MIPQVKIVVDIGKKEFPHDWPNFLQQVYDLRQSSLMLCLVLCKTICEEFVANREDMPAARKADLKMHLLQEVPSIMMVAVEVLVNIHDTCIKSPPFASPTDGVSGAFGMGMHSPVRSPHAVNFPMIGESPSKAAFPLSPARSSGLSSEAIIHGGHIHGDNVVLCRLALDTLHSLLSWVPIEEHTHASLVIDTIFKFAQVGRSKLSVRAVPISTLCIHSVDGRWDGRAWIAGNGLHQRSDVTQLRSAGVLRVRNADIQASVRNDALSHQRCTGRCT